MVSVFAFELTGVFALLALLDIDTRVAKLEEFDDESRGRVGFEEVGEEVVSDDAPAIIIPLYVASGVRL